MAQNFLFNFKDMNISKEQTKELVKKANKPSSAPQRRVAKSGANKIATKVNTILEAIRGKMEAKYGEFDLFVEGDEEKIIQYFDKIKAAGIASLDCEGSSKYAIESKLAGICLYVEGERACYIPTGHWDYEGNVVPGQVSEEFITEQLYRVININWVFHNADYDIRVVRRNLKMSKYLHVFWDTQLASNFLNEIENHQLKVLWSKYIGKGAEADTFGKLFDGMGFNWLPFDKVYPYAANDPKITMELFRFQYQYLNPESEVAKKKDLAECGKLLMDIEIPLIPAIAEIEDRGVCLDEEKTNYLIDKYKGKLEEAEKKADEVFSSLDYSKLAPELRQKLSSPVNINSPQQLAIIFYDVLKFKSVDRRSPRGTGEAIVDKLREEHPEHEDLFNSIIEVRKMGKYLGTYIEKMPEIRNKITNRVHGNFNQYGAKTGRFSSSDPNLQNIPSKGEAKEIRKMFSAADGYYLVGADYSQQEPRVLAHLTAKLFGDTSMADAYASGKDLYAWMASEIYSKPYEECKEFLPDGTKNPEGKVRRDSVKSILLGLMYGREVKSVGVQLGISEDEAQKIFDLVYKTFPAIKKVVDYYVDMAKTHGYVKTIWGRKRRLPDIQLPEYDLVYCDNSGKFPKATDRRVEDQAIVGYYVTRYRNAYGSKARMVIKKEANEKGFWIEDNTNKIAEAHRQVLNSVIQGSSADITKKAMLDLYRSEELREMDFHMLLTVHDEIIGEAPEAVAKKCGEVMSAIMIAATVPQVSVAMKVDAEITKVWYGEEVA